MKPQDMTNHDLLAEYDEVRDTPVRDLSDDSHDALQYRLEELREEILGRLDQLDRYRKTVVQYRLMHNTHFGKLEKGEIRNV